MLLFTLCLALAAASAADGPIRPHLVHRMDYRQLMYDMVEDPAEGRVLQPTSWMQSTLRLKMGRFMRAYAQEHRSEAGLTPALANLYIFPGFWGEAAPLTVLDGCGAVADPSLRDSSLSEIASSEYRVEARFVDVDTLAEGGGPGFVGAEPECKRPACRDFQYVCLDTLEDPERCGPTLAEAVACPGASGEKAPCVDGTNGPCDLTEGHKAVCVDGHCRAPELHTRPVALRQGIEELA